MSTVDTIKERLSIADIISAYVKLDKAGNNLKGKCPFHNERTPSFFVSPDRGTYYCFGCGAKGDIFTFVENFEGLDFVGALKVLAERAGVELVRENPTARSEKDRVLLALETATIFFERGFSLSPAETYLTRRGLTTATIRQFRIGYVPQEWRLLYDHLKSKGFSDTEIEKAGLSKRIDKESKDVGGRYYDTFRGRVMFPLSDSSGRVIGFSGRVLVDDEKSPKYVNSPETVVFSKSHFLFGYDKAKYQIRQQDYSILVEGQMDLIMSHQAGFLNTVASSGTALTFDQLKMLNRLSSRIMMAFDADGAGFKAAIRSAKMALESGMDVKVVTLPKGEDPASLILSDKEAWKNAIRTSKHIIDFYLDRVSVEESDPRKRAKKVAESVLPFVTLLSSDIEKGHFVGVIARALAVKEEVVWADLSKVKIETTAPAVSDTAASPPHADISKRNYVERRLLGILLWQETLSDNEAMARGLRKRLEEAIGKQRLTELEDVFLPSKNELIFEAELTYRKPEVLPKAVDEMIRGLEKDILKEQLEGLMRKLYEFEREKKSDEAKEILKQCQALSHKIATL
ncbi:MAG: DNA primase [Patescibacteria group bacterium]